MPTTYAPPPPTDDELALPHFESALWEALAATHTASAGRSRRRRGAGAHPGGRRTFAAVAAVTLAGAAVAAAVVASGGDTPETVTSPAATASPTDQPGDTVPPVPTTVPGGGDAEGTPPAPGSPEAELLEGVEAALATAEDMIAHTHQDNATYGDDDMWVDEATGHRRSLQVDDAGAPSFDSGLTVAPDPQAPAPAAIGPDDLPTDPDLPSTTTRTVDYCFREYTEAPEAQLPPRKEAELLRDGLADGSLVVDGTEVVGGRELVRLADRDSLDLAPDLRIVQLVDPETFLPAGAIGYGGLEADGYVQTIDYLPRTPENMALLVAPVEPGFALVDSLRGDADRADAGCT